MNELLDANEDKILRLLEFRKDNYFDEEINTIMDQELSFIFYRTPESTHYPLLSEIPEYQIVKENDENHWLIKIETAHSTFSTHYPRNIYGIERIARDRTGNSLTGPAFKKAFRFVELYSIISTLNRSETDSPALLCTENPFLLSQRNHLKSYNFEGPVIVANVEEIKEIIDLIMKLHGEYRIAPNYDIKGKNGWYTLLLNAKLKKRVNRSNPSLSALTRRFEYLLRTIDEIAFRYYSDVDNESTDDIIYYFHYYLTLAVGIFDTLAMIVNEEYNLGCKPTQLSLSEKRQILLPLLKEKNSELHSLIIGNQDIIQTTSELRNKVVHREMLERSIIDMSRTDEGWTGGFLEINEEEYNTLGKYCEGIDDIGRADSSGLFKIIALKKESELDTDTLFFIEPYELSKSFSAFLVQFVSKFLELLNEKAVIIDGKECEDAMDRFRKGSLAL